MDTESPWIHVSLVPAVGYTLLVYSFLTAVALGCMWSTSAPSIAAPKAAPAALGGQKDSIVLVIAHPDDEAMFFVPSILHLRQHFHVHVLCLSNGNFDGLGKVREKELLASCVGVLGCKAPHVHVVDRPELPDGMQADWPAAIVAEEVEEYVRVHRIQAVLTFDEGGVSGHINHIHTHRGVLHWAAVTKLQRSMTPRARQAWDAAHAGDPTHPRALAARRIPVWQLLSTGLARKYAGAIDLGLSALLDSEHGLGLDPVRLPTAFPGYTGHTPVGSALLLTSPDLLTSHCAMVAHASQYVWYRRLFIFFSRYTTLNSLVRVA